jgi:hypothetical protein
VLIPRGTAIAVSASMRYFRSVLTGCLFVLVANTALAQSPRAHYADDLGTLGGTFLLATAMNNNGDIVGSGTTRRWNASRVPLDAEQRARGSRHVRGRGVARHRHQR